MKPLGLCALLILRYWVACLFLIRRASVLPVFVPHFGISARRCHFGSRSIVDRSHRLDCRSLVRGDAVPFRALVLCLLDASLARCRRIRVFGVGAAWSRRAVSGWLGSIGNSYFPCHTPCTKALT
jgi:hypothetical protein